ncbi:MAG: lysylphosphatidylglycerol synthase transmembrane domain-containing protein [Bryobacteraceae bacterium]
MRYLYRRSAPRCGDAVAALRGGEIQHRWWKWAAGGLVVAAVGVGLVWRFSPRAFDWHLAAASVAGLDWMWIGLSLLPVAGTYYVRALRWAVFLKPLKPHPSIRNLLSATVIGFTAITLFGRAGEFVRPYLIAVKEKVPFPSQLAAWLLERIFDLLMVLLFFAFALMRITSTGVHVGPRLAWVLAAGGRFVAASCLGLLVLLFAMRHFAEPVRRYLTHAIRFWPERHFARAEKLLAGLVQGVESTRSDGALLAIFLYSVLEWMLIAASYWCLTRSFEAVLHFSVVDVIIFVGFVSFGAAVQIPGVGGGLQVAAVVVLTELFRVRLEPATSFAILLWILSFVVIVPVGLMVTVKEGLDWRSLRRMGREQ